MRSWEPVWNTHVNALAENWFRQSLVSTRDVWSIVDPEIGEALEEQGSYLADTPLATNFILVPGIDVDRPVAGASLEHLPYDVADEDGRLSAILSGLGVVSFRVGDLLKATWPTKHGGDVVITAEACRAKDGRTFVYWHSSPLVSSQPLPENDIAVLSVAAAIPLALQSAVYLAENPLPAGAAAIDRSILMGMAWPGPFIEPESRMVIDGTFLARLDDSGMIHGFRAPVRIDVGYPLPLDSSDEDLACGIKIAVDTAIHLTGIFEDGYLHHRSGELDFHEVLSSQSILGPEARPRGGPAQEWLPATRARDYLDVLQVVPLV
jgi:hypothetical protein